MGIYISYHYIDKIIMVAFDDFYKNNRGYTRTRTLFAAEVYFKDAKHFRSCVGTTEEQTKKELTILAQVLQKEPMPGIFKGNMV